ncbi:MAG: restriction endonuclease subunit S [Bacteroidaceae bacterium]|nr:restriction endonuclease subunit S [Bacteroidaceae bacterium]
MVEWKKLGEQLDYEQPTPYLVKSTEYDNSFDVPVLTAGHSLLLGYTNEKEGVFKASKDNPTIIFDDFTTSFHWIDFEFKVKSSAMKMLRPKNGVNFRYVYYSMCGINFIPSGHQRHWISKYSHFQIPIPSLSEQTRIVSILDTFTASIDNLKKQIAERRKQYEYERDQLLDLEGKEGVEMKKLGECVLFITDGDHQPPPKSSEGIPFVTISDIEKLSHTIDFSNTFFVPQEYYNSLKSDKKAKKGDVLYTVTGSFGIPVLIEDNREFCFQRHIALIRPNNTIALSRYIYHWLCSNYAKKQGEEKASGGAQKTVSLNSLRSFRFYYPPLQAQSRIVSILDTFEASIANLEAQLKLREKQYEYYRNQLLTFE